MQYSKRYVVFKSIYSLWIKIYFVNTAELFVCCMYFLHTATERQHSVINEESTSCCLASKYFTVMQNGDPLCDDLLKLSLRWQLQQTSTINAWETTFMYASHIRSGMSMVFPLWSWEPWVCTLVANSACGSAAEWVWVQVCPIHTSGSLRAQIPSPG